MSIIDNIYNWRGRHLIRDFLGIELLKTRHREEWITLPDGRRVYSHVHGPERGVRHPGVVFVPGGGSPGTDYDGRTELTADDVAALGFTVMHYDPAGRGLTGGEEDHWGPVHQEELSHVMRHFSRLPDVRPEGLSIISFSIGIIIAAGALARFPMTDVSLLYDWEGPSNRFNITLNDTHEPLKDFPTSNDVFWNEREPSRFMGHVRCGYFRYQAHEDHMHGTYKGHALELLNLAAGGSAAWSRCNANPENTFYDEERVDEYDWVPGDMDHKGMMLRYFMDSHLRAGG